MNVFETKTQFYEPEKRVTPSETIGRIFDFVLTIWLLCPKTLSDYNQMQRTIYHDRT